MVDPSIGMMPFFDFGGNLFTVGSLVFGPGDQRLCADRWDPGTFRASGGGCWDGGNPGSINTGGIVAVGACNGAGCSWSLAGNGGTVSQKRYTSITGGTVSAWNRGAFSGGNGNLFLWGTGLDGSTSCGETRCTEARRKSID